MSNIKRLIIVVVICILIITTMLVIILNYNKQEEKNNNTTYNENEEIISGDLYNYEEPKIETVTNKTSFFTVSQCISDYLNKINTKNTAYYGTDESGNEVKIIDDETIATSILNVLDKNYVSKNNITVSNIKQFINMLEQKEIFIPLKMSILPGRITEKYAVYGFTQDMEYNFKEEYYFIVTLDLQNSTYQIEPINNNNYKSIEEIKLENKDEPISKNDDNQYIKVFINNEYIANQYLETYKRMLLGNSDLAYQYLNEEYKTKKYGNIGEFKKQIENKKGSIKGITLEQYSDYITPNSTQYICIDQNGRYYIFEETAPMQYKVILDTYTIDLPEFTQKYAQESNENKVLMNIQKFFTSIEDGDYKYAYNKLDETYRTNSFKTQLEFENYVKQNFFIQNKLAAGKVEKQGDIYLYNITITDATKKDTKTITKSFVMQLKEGTDFIMSFEK